MAVRREGFIERRGKDKQGQDKWLLRISRQSADGKRVRESKVFVGKKSEAEKALKAWMQVDPETRNVEKLTYAQHVAEWLGDVVKHKVSARTFTDYKYAVERHIQPVLGKFLIQKIRLADVMKVYTQMRERKLSPRTIRYVHTLLSASFKWAVKCEYIDRNPAAYVELDDRNRQEGEVVTKERVVVGDEEAAKAFRQAAIACWRRATLPTTCALRDCTLPVLARGLCSTHYASARRVQALPESPAVSEWGLLLVFEIATGMRPGELQALQWPDIAWKESAVHVVRAVEWIGPKWNFVEPKTKRSRRTITLPPSLLVHLRTHRAHQNEHRLRLGEYYQNHDLVFAAPSGGPFDRRLVNRNHLPKVLKAAGLPETMTMYSLRHSMATVLLKANENPKVVSERLGHASIVLTMDTYQHVIPSMQKGTASKLESLMFGDDGDEGS